MSCLKREYQKYFFLTFAWTWVLLSIPILLRMSYHNPVAMVIHALACIAPSAVGIILAHCKHDKVYWKDFWHRICNFRQIGLRWYAFIFLFFPVISMIVVAFYYRFSGTLPELTTLKSFLTNPLKLLLFALYMLAFGPIAEEIGWRGYALDHLEKRYSWFSSSLILSSFWASWHLPLFFIQDTYQNRLIQESFIYFIDFMLAFFPQSIIMDWIYNNNRKSILSGILFHFCINFFGETIDLPNHLKMYVNGITFVVAIAILISWKKKRDVYKRIDAVMANRHH